MRPATGPHNRLWRGCEQLHGRGGNLIGCSVWWGGVGVWWGCGGGCGGGGGGGVVGVCGHCMSTRLNCLQ